MTIPDSFLIPDWPAPANVKTLITTRQGGISKPPYDSLNLGQHVGDDDEAVQQNRQLLAQAAGSNLAFQWIRQIHGSEVLVLENALADESTQADAVFTRQRDIACGVLTADCLSVFLCTKDGSEIAVAHAGWRGLAGGVLENTLEHFNAGTDDILAYLGPVIGPCHFEVGPQVREAFLDTALAEIKNEAGLLFQESGRKGKWMGDLYALAKIILGARGIKKIYGEPLCTYCEFDHFYSYRRDGETGRFASIIWLE